jgi:hypothetical protein
MDTGIVRVLPCTKSLIKQLAFTPGHRLHREQVMETLGSPARRTLYSGLQKE